MPKPWPFDDEPEVACVTVSSILNGVQSILLVSRDAEDASWQMLTGEAFDIAEARLVQLKNLVELDPSLLELADLPLGWSAGRERVGAPWTCHPDSEQTEN